MGDISKVVICASVHLPYLSCDVFPKNNIYTVFYWEAGMFLLILTPVFTPLCPQTKINMVIYQKVSPVLPPYSPTLTPGSPEIAPNQVI